MEKKKKSASVDILKPLKVLSKRFHLTLFFILVAAGLSAAVLLINNTLKDSSANDPTYTSSINAGSIDKVTLTRLNALHTSTQATPAPALPAGRTNPVNE
jgi:hypothetical protein